MTPEQRETWKEHQERLYAMAVDDGETWDLSANDQAACNAGGDAIMALLDRAALRAPAVTGEAQDAQPMSERTWTTKELVEAIQHGIATARMQWTCPHCERQSAPPAAGAPPALVALDVPTLLQAAKRFGRLAEQFVGPPSRLAQTRRAERDAAVHALRDAEKLLIGLVEKQRAWSPAPAPVAPPLPPDYVVQRRFMGAFLPEMAESLRVPAPPAVAGGDEPAYDPKFGDDRECACGHAYERHFDTYDDMKPVGCKYCDCLAWRRQEGQ